MSEQKEAIAKVPSGRPRRVPVGTRNILTVIGKDSDHEYRIVNDSGDRVQEFLDAGYVIDKQDSVRVGDKRVNSPTAEGTAAQVSVGQGQKAYVMKIRKEWYEEDQAAKQAKVKQIEDATKAKALDGTYGKFEITRD
jgi:hypothetical protein